jgi:hypothetical protein
MRRAARSGKRGSLSKEREGRGQKGRLRWDADERGARR